MFARITISCSIVIKKSSLAIKLVKQCVSLDAFCACFSLLFLSLSLTLCISSCNTWWYCTFFLFQTVWFKLPLYAHASCLFTLYAHKQTNTLIRLRPYIFFFLPNTQFYSHKLLSQIGYLMWMCACAVVFLWFCYCIHARIASIRFGRFYHRYSV